MEKYIKMALIGLVFTGCVSRQCHKNDSRSVANAQTLTFEDFALASNIVVQTFDKTSNVCAIPDDKIFALPQKWKALVDQRFQQEKSIFMAKNESERSSFGPSDCSKTCSCAVYANFFEFLDQSGVTLSTRTQDHWNQLSKAASELNLNEPRCIQDGEWFCDSRLMKELLKD